VTRLRDLARSVRAALLRTRVRMSARPVGLAVVYHVLATRNGDPAHELVVPHATSLFEAQVAHLRRHYRPVTGSELPAATAGRRRGGRLPVAITFDDDARSHTEIAAPLLEAAGVRATFYLTGNALDGPGGHWCEELQVLWRDGDRAAREHLADVAAGGARPLSPDEDVKAVGRAVEMLAPERHDAVTAELRTRVGRRELMVPGLEEPQIRRLADAGHEIGFHTRRHYRLTGLDDERLADAMTEGRDLLAQAAGAPLRTIAYPHGRADRRVAAAARGAGFTLGFTSDAGRYRPGRDEMRVGRYWPSYESAAHFAVEVAQLLADRWGVDAPAEDE
jgi:peptidoglycan/xylan/chitin deacetylase (PgdA/CDA1 family)